MAALRCATLQKLVVSKQAWILSAEDLGLRSSLLDTFCCFRVLQGSVSDPYKMLCKCL